MQVKLTTAELQTLLDAPTSADFPKYATQIINLANQNAQGTRPKIVGQQTDLIQEFPGRTLSEWQEWYLEKYPDAIETATDRIYTMVERLQHSIAKIDREMVRRWVQDLVLVKTFIGLRFQEAILRKIAESRSLSYRVATVAEEAQGIDGYIGELPVSIKPDTYKAMQALPENISVSMIYYTKKPDGILLSFDF